MIETLWRTYAGTWSLDTAERTKTLAQCVDPDVTYCDPNSKIAGIDNLSAYMAGFQTNFPDASFEITGAYEHNARTVARWNLTRSDGTVAMRGVSFAHLAPDRKMLEITGFFENSQ